MAYKEKDNVNEDIKEILKIAVFAPSGDNSQPWRFEVVGNELFVFNVPEKDLSLYNLDNNACYIAHGALIENIRLLSLSKGYEPTILEFPDLGDKNIVAQITLNKLNKDYIGSLHNYIFERSTNRKKYKNIEIEKDKLDSLVKLSWDQNVVRVKFVLEKRKIDEIAHAASRNEEILLSTKEMHKTLFHHVTWNEEEDNTKHGFYIKTFEFNIIQGTFFRIFKSWRILSFFNIFGIARTIANENEKIFKTSAAFGAIIIASDSKHNYLHGGMLMQRIWLEATKFGLSIQPITGISFLIKRIQKNIIYPLTEDKTNIISNAFNVLESNFESRNATIAMAFRIGYSDKPSARTTRSEPEILFK